MIGSLPSNITPTHHINVISSSKIEKKVTQLLTILFPPVDADSEKIVSRKAAQISNQTGTASAADIKPVEARDSTVSRSQATKSPVIHLTATSPVANKLISIVEIVKRETASRLNGQLPASSEDVKSSKPRKLWQYTSLTHQAPKPKGPKPRVKSETDAAPLAADAEDGASVPKNNVVDQSLKRKRDDSIVNDEEDEDAHFFERLDSSTKHLALAVKLKEPRPVPVLCIVLSLERMAKLDPAGWGEQSVRGDVERETDGT
ncbi:MAG: hypothetical protein Q9162_001909 [Coniocarpon cinnabarinum]